MVLKQLPIEKYMVVKFRALNNLGEADFKDLRLN